MVLALAALLAGCKGCTMQEKGENQGKRVVSAEAAGCRLDVEVLRADAEGVDLRYSFHNGALRSAYLFNRLYWKVEGDVLQTDRDRVYVVVDSSGVTLSKKIFPVPDDINAEYPVVPAATRVAPGESMVETVHLKVPLSPHAPYLRWAADPTAAPRKLPVSFELGFFLVVREHLAYVVKTTDGPAYSFGSTPASSQTILRAGPLTSVPALLLRPTRL